VTVGSLTLGAVDVTFGDEVVLDEWDRRLLESARHIATLLLVIDRAVRGGLFGGLRSQPDGAAPIIGSSPAIRAVRERIERVAATDFAVLIEGESGSGKELVARQIHDVSLRRNGPFVAVNCAAIVETLLEAELFGIEERIATGVRARRGKFEHAHEGTLFLDEVADLSPAAQAKLLRAIQEMSIERVGGAGSKAVDVRGSDVRIGRVDEGEGVRLCFAHEAEVGHLRGRSSRSPECAGGPVPVGRRDKEHTRESGGDREPARRIGDDDVALIRYRDARDTSFGRVAHAIAVCVFEDDAAYRCSLARDWSRDAKTHDA